MTKPRVVIIGAGFGGLACAKALGNSEIDVTVVDRRNHNLFQPLLYQVATAALSPADVSEPIRRTLARYDNIRVLMGEVNGIDSEGKAILLSDGARLPYDRLIIATGSEYNYFGHDEWHRHAPGLKSVHEARQIRHRLLLAFEQAERSTDEAEKRRLLTSVIVGGGPTGVEMAGAISELGSFMIAKDFDSLSRDQFRVLLVEAGPRILASFPQDLSDYAAAYLTRIGVEIHLKTAVEDIEPDRIRMAGEWLPAGCIVWGAGVKASPAARWLGVEPGPAGRLPVDPRLAVIGRPDIYALGDTALALDADGKPLPALAQVAKQQGLYLGKALKAELLTGAISPPFAFHNRGNTAVIGRNAAIFDFGRWHLKGRFAWFLWAIVHVWLLVNFEKRLLVSIQWLWRYATRQRGARLIDEDAVGHIMPSSAADPQHPH
ncbi:pyridine nucleotide-disulfide oxidoreductase [Rhizobium sp. Root274]|uniref:NAD(P)/FAD-dependent oxidoreductase n=1 Tax=unclassified Rhizobium TaxID=2613769 RepID=UPI000713AA02|nr:MULTISPECIES: NAD(P)/FAD-dependent oxidoreductase [unclassified Rhizobium]KQW32145.1 pyridine nucleotide-disulfide oxidoreductase [Rhizobium sp. Root1240]KRD33684.1 pyridine nucleotide-disulfide oxidoreductase [Rhizobium sp. Root274]